MAVEAIRGCGYRKVGGLYLVSDGIGQPCCRLPIPIRPCVTCGEQIKFSRSFQRVKLGGLLMHAPACQHHPGCTVCPLCGNQPDKVGLLWVGKQHYTPDEFTSEAVRLGVSRRISALPKEFRLGMWVLLAHIEAVDGICDCSGPKGVGFDPKCERCKGMGHTKMPGVFHAFKPKRVELVIVPSMREEAWVAELVEKGVTLVEVPEDDPDHKPVKRKVKSRREAAAERVAKEREEGKPLEHPDQTKLDGF